MTILQTIKYVDQYYRARLNPREKRFVSDMLENLDGLGDINDRDVMEYISPGQKKFARDIGKKFLITEHSK
jgi:hypothetical protein